MQNVQEIVKSQAEDTDFDKLTEKDLSGMFKHNDHLQERLDFIKYSAYVSKTKLTQS